MASKLAPGTKLCSAICKTEVIVVRGGDIEQELQCGGEPMVAHGGSRAEEIAKPGFDEGTLMGKRYTDTSGSIELLCTSAGKGSLSLGDDLLTAVQPKTLPSSD